MRMKRIRRAALLLALCMAFALTGCEKPPKQQEMPVIEGDGEQNQEAYDTFNAALEKTSISGVQLTYTMDSCTYNIDLFNSFVPSALPADQTVDGAVIDFIGLSFGLCSSATMEDQGDAYALQFTLRSAGPGLDADCIGGYMNILTFDQCAASIAGINPNIGLTKTGYFDLSDGVINAIVSKDSGAITAMTLTFHQLYYDVITTSNAQIVSAVGGDICQSVNYSVTAAYTFAS